MLRHRTVRLLPALLAAVSVLAPAVAQATPTTDAIIRQCAQEGIVGPGYSQADLSAALTALPADVREYSPCVDALAAAQQAIALAAAQRANPKPAAPSGLSAAKGAAPNAVAEAGEFSPVTDAAGAPIRASDPEVAKALEALDLGERADTAALATPSEAGLEARDRPIAPVVSAAASALLLAGSGLALARPGILRRRRLAP